MADIEKKPTEKEIRKATEQINSLLEKPELLDLLSEMTENQQLFGKVSANPREFLKKRGMVVPNNAELNFEQKALALRIRVTVTVCVQICIRIGNFVICGRICGTGTVSL